MLYYINVTLPHRIELNTRGGAQMAKKALIILADGFEETEAIMTVDILRRANIEVTLAGLTAMTVKSSHSITLVAETLLKDTTDDFDAIILPGGSRGAENLHQSELVNALIKKMRAEGKLIAAICAAPAIVLAPTGILDNRSATCFPSMEDNFNPSTKFKAERVVIDDAIITSRAAGTTGEFALAIVENLAGKNIAQKIKADILA